MFKEPGDAPSTKGLVPNDEPTKENSDASTVPRRVLDFSSGSEDNEDEQRFKKKASNPSAMDSNRDGGGNAASGPGRMSLLQHGFSRFLERVQGRRELGEGDSIPYIEESPSDTEAEDHEKLKKNECTSSDIYKSSNTGNAAICPLKLGTKTCDVPNGSDREDRRNGTGGRQNMVSLLKESDDALREKQDL